jgi:transposase
MEETSVGIDVSKSKLDIYLLPEKRYLTVSNDKKGFQKLIKFLKDPLKNASSTIFSTLSQE